MRSATTARVWFALTATVVFAGLAIQIVDTAEYEGGHFGTVGGRLFNLLCFFTIQSNIIVCVTTLLLAISVTRGSTIFRVFRLDGLVCITVTFVVFQLALRHLQDLTGTAAVADALLHTVSPIMCVVGWLLFGPRCLTSLRVTLLSMLYPIAWMVFTLVRGPIVDYYPYPFIDPRDNGYLTVSLNLALIAVLFLAVAGGATWLDKRLPWGVQPELARQAS
jgi:hypothetical protein